MSKSSTIWLGVLLGLITFGIIMAAVVSLVLVSSTPKMPAYTCTSTDTTMSCR